MTEEKSCPPSLFLFRREALAASLSKPSLPKPLSDERSDVDPLREAKSASLKRSELLELVLSVVRPSNVRAEVPARSFRRKPDEKPGDLHDW